MNRRLTYTHAIGQGAEHITEIEVAPFNGVYSSKEQAPLCTDQQ